jgi:hypothetical protein
MGGGGRSEGKERTDSKERLYKMGKGKEEFKERKYTNSQLK